MLRALKRIIFWTYLRGSWQYDILCGLILCFIFLMPRGVFDGSAFINSRPRGGEQQETPAPEAQKASIQPASQGDEADRSHKDVEVTHSKPQ